MANKSKITNQDATEKNKGISLLSSDDESIAGDIHTKVITDDMLDPQRWYSFGYVGSFYAN